jgi:cytochrome c oxidase subunit 2
MIAEISLWTSAASTTAEKVDRLFAFLMIVCGAVGLLVAFLIITFCIVYRRRPGETGNPPPSPQPRLLEWFWTLSPLAVFGIMFIWGGEVYLSAFIPPEEATPVYVVAKQWMWKFQHPEGQREINTLHVPVGKPVKLLLVSEDVIHSFYVPAFRVHMDVLPQRYTSVWFQATRPGTYHLFCSQYCGTNHAGMTGQIVVMEQADYQRWLHLHAEGSLALRGRQIFLKYRCLSCHSADEKARAPVLENLFDKRVALRDGTTVRANYGYLRESILHPSSKIVAGYEDIMPPFEGQITEDEIIALVAFLQSLGEGETPARVENYPPPAKTPAIDAEANIP